MIYYLKSFSFESVIDTQGIIIPAEMKSCIVDDTEVQIGTSEAILIFLFLVEDAARSEAEIEESQDTDRPYPRLGQELRLDHRWLDLRTPANNAIIILK